MKIWQYSLAATYDPSVTTLNFVAGNGGKTVTLGWPVENMDSTEIAEHGFTKGDLMYLSVWSNLSKAQIVSGMSLSALGGMSAKEKRRVELYTDFRGTLAGAYYGTPRARRWAAFLSLDAFVGNHANNESFVPRRGVGSMIMAEIISHPWKYPSYQMPRNLNVENAEPALAGSLIAQFERVVPTFAEDRLRFAGCVQGVCRSQCRTATYSSGKVTLANKLVIPLEPADDGVETAPKRNAWLVEQFENPPTAPVAGVGGQRAAVQR